MREQLTADAGVIAGQPPRRGKAILVIAAVAAVGAVFPFLLAGEPFLLMLASYALTAAIVALSLDLLTGNTGLLSFGHAAWYGFGAYAAGLLSKTVTSDIVLLVLMTMLATAVIATLIGAVLVRQIGKTFAILTLAFSQIIFAIVFVFSGLTGGEDGLQGIPVPTFFGLQVFKPEVWFWIFYGVLVISLAFALHVRRSPLGKAWLAIRDNAERASFIGMNVNRLKLIAYSSSATLAAVAGALFVLFNGAASPDLLSWFESGKILMYVVLGGVGTLVGPILGAIAFTVAEHYVSSFTDAWLIYFGGLFVLMVIVAPGGIFGALSGIWTRGAASREAAQ
ncbi:branched-chain amino acid ABC transporter permease [Hoeflea olei]|uniref:branched-chain amino acid ABC transporter permease n=1 Tax=Hoeflea olei TaxID=1480615 RepID=UPI0009F2A2DD|nr:branched-chain amino acid ABC transporter permease [Hoeflea olei]